MSIQPASLAALDPHADKIRQLEEEQRAEESAQKQRAEEMRQALFTPPQRRPSPPIQVQEIYQSDSVS